LPKSTDVVSTMQDLASRLRSATEELNRLAQQAEALSDEVTQGRRLGDVLAAGPLVTGDLKHVLDDLASARTGARRAEAEQLSDEGLTRMEIATLFEVTPQRVSAILASTTTGAAHAGPPVGP
jgi:ABC-type transporter Mla subunit MlaD